MKRMMRIAAVAFALAIGFSLNGCEREEGPAEEATEKIGNALERAGRSLDKTLQDIDKDAREAVEQGEKEIDKALDNLSNTLDQDDKEE